MEQLARVSIFIELLLVNLLTSHTCSKKKYRKSRIISVLVLYTLLVLVVSITIKVKLNLQSLSNGTILLIGLTYFFPLKHLYLESSDKVLAIMFFSWIHTMTVSFLSAEISTALGFQRHSLITFLVQTIIYLFTTPVVIRFVKKKFLYILSNIPKQINKHLLALSVVEFGILCIVILYSSENRNSLWTTITIFLVILTVAISFHLIYIIVNNSKNINQLKHLAYTDSLTGTKNRLALFNDCEKLIAKQQSFSIIYMDLDNFKKINDTYGHFVGDDYLIQFTKATKEIVGVRGVIYRISGDEFVCIYNGNNIDLLISIMDQKIGEFLELKVPFLGVSIGHAKFPKDAVSLDELIKKADRRMYSQKQAQKSSSY